MIDRMTPVQVGSVFAVVCGLGAVIDGFPLWGIAVFSAFKWCEGYVLWRLRRRMNGRTSPQG